MNKLRLLVIFILSCLVFSCNKPKDVVETGFSDLNNPKEEQTVSVYGETVKLTFNTKGAWTATLDEGQDWVTLISQNGNDSAGRGSVKLEFAKNITGENRTVTLWITVTGYKKEVLAVFEQSSGFEESPMSDYLIAEMEKRLSTEYLWADAYNKIEKTKVPYDEYLFANLTKLGATNIEDGGYYRDFSSYAGERYIYSYIQEISYTKADELLPTYGLGIGPMMSSKYNNDPASNKVGLILAYVYRNSPAEKAGLCRGDIIWNVNGIDLTFDNYQSYMNQLFYNPSGTYTLKYSRYVLKGNNYSFTENNVASVTAESFGYDPVLFAATVAKDNITEANNLPDFNIGYLVTESFDLSAQFIIEDQIKQFVDAGIKDLVLDLRFNVGGAVPQSRYMASAIAGKSHDKDIFFKAEYVDGHKEDWTFGSGYINAPDGLTHAPDLGLNRLFVIVSENTASASEMLINSLRGIDFPVTMIGSRTEGKNVGMVVSNINYNGRKFEFAPITFRCYNAKDEGDYADGMLPEGDNLLNNQNDKYDDDLDALFPYAVGDWGDMTFNSALYFCFCDILGYPRFEESNATKAPLPFGPRCAQHSEVGRMQPLMKTAIQPRIGRFGNVIYSQE